MGTIANITVGPSQLFIAAAGTALPTLTGNATDFGAFTEVGFTSDGIEWDYTPTWKDIVVDELMGPAKKILTSHKLVVSAKLAETTLQNLAYAIPGATFAGTRLTIGSIQAPEFVLGWLGPAPAVTTAPTVELTRECLAYRVVSIAAVKAHYQRKDMVIYATQFECLADPTQLAPADLATWADFATASALL
jgi:hypothetical protein